MPPPVWLNVYRQFTDALIWPRGFPLDEIRAPLAGEVLGSWFVVPGSPITDHRSPITDHRSPITDHRSPITDHRSPITDHRSPITDHRSPITDHRSPITDLAGERESPCQVTRMVSSRVSRTESARGDRTYPVPAPIQQGLANGSPDVDAVWRLALDRPFDFEPDRPSVLLPPGAWCPFNSQSTWWWPEAFPLLYLPSHCSFRMTDIWRGFIAQRCLWELGCGLVFHGPEVVQERNVHNLMRDFSDEIPGYTRNRELVECLTAVPLEPGLDAVGKNLRTCYATLIEHGFFPEIEGTLVDAWLADLANGG